MKYKCDYCGTEKECLEDEIEDDKMNEFYMMEYLKDYCGDTPLPESVFIILR